MEIAWRIIHIRSVLGFVNRVLMLVGFLRADAKVNCVPTVARAAVGFSVCEVAEIEGLGVEAGVHS